MLVMPICYFLFWHIHLRFVWAGLILSLVHLRAICRLCFSYDSKSCVTLPSTVFGVLLSQI